MICKINGFVGLLKDKYIGLKWFLEILPISMCYEARKSLFLTFNYGLWY